MSQFFWLEVHHRFDVGIQLRWRRAERDGEEDGQRDEDGDRSAGDAVGDRDSADLEADNPSKVRPLHSALVRPTPRLVRLLLDRDADVNAKQAGGYTALHSAAKRGDNRIVTILLDAGADAPS